MKSKQLLQILCWAGLGLGATEGYGQGQRLGGATPDAKMLPGGASAGGGMGSLYSPNLYDGSANINIPIYQYSSDNSDFGVSFSYNTKGVKLDEIASDIGLHWDISSGPSISRTVKDLPDEINLLDGDTVLFQWSGLSWMQPIPGYDPAPNDTVSLNPFWAFKGKYATYSESAGSAADPWVYRDKEADDFIVSLGGSSFTFNLGKNGTFFTHPHRGVKIEPLWDGEPYTSIGDLEPRGQALGSDQNLLSFRITDEQGNQYLFTRSIFSEKLVEDQFGQGMPVTSYNYTSQWVASEVTLANGSKIKYNYASRNWNESILPAYRSYSKRNGWLWYVIPHGSSIVPSSKNTLKIQSIEYPNSVVVYFNYDSRPRADYPYGALREIRVATSQNCLSYIMQQSFFKADFTIHEKAYEEGLTTTPYSPRDTTLRLKLNSILLNSCDSTIQEPFYSFEYDLSYFPARLHYQQDYFGYYNNGTMTGGGSSSGPPEGTMIPKYTKWTPDYGNPTQMGSDYGLNRSSHLASMKAAMLTKVKNAYGGSASFYYGAHQMGPNVLANLPVSDSLFLGEEADDGLRLDSIVEAEPFHPGNTKVTQFSYSGGQRFLTGGYFHSTDKLMGTEGSNVTTVYNEIMTGTYLSPHQLVNGSNHGYSQVSVTTKTGAGALLSRKEIKFSNLSDGPGHSRYFVIGGGKDFFTYPYTDKQYLKDWELGLPLEVTEYDQNNRIVQKTVNKYKFTLDTTSAIGKVENRKTGLVPVFGWRMPGISRVVRNKEFTDDYRPYTGAALLDSTTVYKYLSDNTFISDVVRYSYDGRNNLSDIYTTDSKGQQIRTAQAYNYSITTLPGSTLYNMTQAGLEKLVGTERWLLGSGGATSHQLLDAYYNTFEFQGGKLRPRYLYNIRIGQPLTYSQYTGYGGSGPLPEPFAQVQTAFTGSSIPYFVKTSEVVLADSKGNPLETRMLGEDFYKAMIWDTVNGQKLAEGNARYQDIAFSGFDATNKGNWEYNAAGATAITNAMAGTSAFAFSSGAVSRIGLTANMGYILTFWASNYTSLPVCTIGGTGIPLIPIATKDPWIYYEARFIAPSSAAVLNISGPTNGYLDELRLFPANAVMQTQTYKSLFGISSSTDATGRITYYEYDKMGRQTVVRDQDGNILSKTEIHIAQ